MKTKNKKEEMKLITVPQRALNPPAVIPKLSKSQIIKAMVEQSRRKHNAAKDEYQEREKGILDKVKVEADKVLVSDIKTLESNANAPCKVATDNGWGPPRDVTMEVTVSSPEIRTLMKEWFKNESTDPGWFQAESHENKIKQAMDSTQDKVDLILAQPENVETIDALLAKIFAKKKED